MVSSILPKKNLKISSFALAYWGISFVFCKIWKNQKQLDISKSTDLYIGCKALVKFLNPGQGDAVLVNYPDFRNNLTISFLNFPISGLPWHSQQFVAFLDDCDFQSHFYCQKLVDPKLVPTFWKQYWNRTNLIAAGK